MIRAAAVRVCLITAVAAVLGRPLVGQTRAPGSAWPWPTGVQAAPDRRADEGDGPFDRLVIRGATVVDGTGAPAQGPMDIVVEHNRIVEVRSVGAPGAPARPDRRPPAGTREIDASGMYVLPGFVDLHGHIGRAVTGAPAEFVYKLWLAHGVTTVREPGSVNGLEWTLRERARSAANQIVAPRIFAYVRPGLGWSKGPIETAESAREYVRWAAEKGVDGLKLGLEAFDPPVMAALIDEAGKHGLGTQAHLSQLGVARMNALDAARLGLGSLEHWYGLPEALLDGSTVQDFPRDYNYSDEVDRFREAGRLWKQTVAPGSAKWNAVRDELVSRRFVLDPTFTVYEKARDVMRAMRPEWDERYTLPSQWRAWMPNPELHGAYFSNWTTADENEWKRNYQRWMAFVNDFKNHGGRVTTGSDSAGSFEQFGFKYIRELELLQEAGFHPLEAIRSATLNGAEVLHEPKKEAITFGMIRPGLLADLVIVPENPLLDTKVLYGTGALRLDPKSGRLMRVGGVRYVIKDGIVYDAHRLLADVAKMVADAKRRDPISYPY